MERKKKKSLPKRFATAMRKNWQLYLMALPAMVLLFCFAYMPMGGLVPNPGIVTPMMPLRSSPRRSKVRTAISRRAAA